MLTVINTALSTAKELIGLVKELKPLFVFITGQYTPDESQVRTFKLFAYLLVSIMFFMAGLATITLMLVHLPLVGSFLEIELIYKISNAAKFFMKTLMLTGYLVVFVIVNSIFIYGMYYGLKNLINKFRR
ncbi:MAG: hypothetical protein J6N72_03810 [Psychrobacter sp.]|nr:hypothetical protein [Psychrobacter sp.]